MKKLTKFAAGLALFMCLSGAAAGTAMADNGDPHPLACNQPKQICTL